MESLNYATNLWQQIRACYLFREVGVAGVVGRGATGGARNYLACHIPQVEEVAVLGCNFNDLPSTALPQHDAVTCDSIVHSSSPSHVPLIYQH